MKTDSIFYRLFQEFPGIFFELIGRSPDEALGYEFTSREVKQLAFRMDGLLLPTTDDRDKPFYLVEVQFQPDKDLYYRLFSELGLYLRQYQPPHPWNVVVVYPTRSIEIEETLQFGEILALNRVRRIYLNELGEEAESSLGVGVVKLVIEAQKKAGEKAKGLIEQAKEQITDEATQRNLIDLIETIIVYKLPQKSREEIEAMLGLSDLKQTKVYQEAFEEGEKIGEQRGEQRGEKIGEQRGERKGEQKAKLEAIPELIKEGLSLEQIARALKLPLEVVQQAAQQSNN